MSPVNNTDNLLQQDILFGRQGHVITYSGNFQTGVSYKKFDFVYNTGDGLFYYAKDDMESSTGEISITAANRYHLCPIEGEQWDYIVDSHNKTVDTDNNILGDLIRIPKNTVIKIEGSADNDGRYKIEDIVPDKINDPHIEDILGRPAGEITGSFIRVHPISDQHEIDTFEPASENPITLSTVRPDPSSDSDLWVNNRFFFDADYGSTVNFKANNSRLDFGNGYIKRTPKSINSLSMTVDLQFKNRSNREANAIIHFVENHLGQLEKDSASPNLQYKQGISGFHWGGESSFHPYDTVENQAKTFYCTDFNHVLSFENSNDVSLKFRNLDDSHLRKTVQGGWIIGGGEEYDPQKQYEMNDFALYTGNMQYYYWEGDSPGNSVPAIENSSWSRDGGHYHDVRDIDYKRYVHDHADLIDAYNDGMTMGDPPAGKDEGLSVEEWGRRHYVSYGYNEQRRLHSSGWTRDFFWKPSLGMTVSQNARLQEIVLKNGYTQLYNDGINESLLELNLTFKNREDDEARAILHFLEQKLGYLPFSFTPPAPYNKLKNFVCEEWSHTYNHKNSHTISAKFLQFPFNLSQSEYQSLNTPPELSEGELVFQSPLVFATEEFLDEANSRIIKARLFFKNIGDLPVTLISATTSDDGPSIEITSIEEVNENAPAGSTQSTDGGSFEIVGATTSNSIPLVPSKLPPEDYIFQIGSLDPDPLTLSNKYVRLSKSYSAGLKDGGQIFTVMELQNGVYVPKIVSGKRDSYFQNNLGQIKNGMDLSTPGEYQDYSQFIVESFFKQRNVSELAGGEEGYLDIVFTMPDKGDLFKDLIDKTGSDSNDIIDNTSDQNNIVISMANRFHHGEITVTSSTHYSPQKGKLTCFVSS